MAKIAVLGSGKVGEVLANGFLKYGDEVVRGSRDPAKLVDWLAYAGPNARTGTFGEATAWAETVVLAVKGAAAEAALQIANPANCAGKTVIDATNPIADQPPEKGVLKFFTGPNDSLMERLQRQAPEARFVKAFSCVGNAYMVDPAFAEGRPSMFICGNHDDAKRQVAAILERFGWDVEDMGGVEAARAIEPLCMLWCIPGLQRNQWNHAFKLIRA